jgi:hypothetical protein
MYELCDLRGSNQKSISSNADGEKIGDAQNFDSVRKQALEWNVYQYG